MRAMVLVQEFRFESGHVNVRRTFAFAGFALQAKIHRVVQKRIVQAGQPNLSCEGKPQGVGPAASAVLLLPRRLA